MHSVAAPIHTAPVTSPNGSISFDVLVAGRPFKVFTDVARANLADLREGVRVFIAGRLASHEGTIVLDASLVTLTR